MQTHYLYLLLLILAITACSKTTGSHSTAERQRLSNLHSQLSLEFILNQNIDVAQGEAEEALRLDPNGLQANYAMARVYEALDQPEKVVAHYQRALRREPGSVVVLNDYGRYLCEQGQTEAALDKYKRAGRQLMNPLRMVSYTRAAACLIRSHNYAQARLFLLKALELNASSLPVLFNLARASYLQEDYDSANLYIGRYFEQAQIPSQEALSLAKKLESHR